MSLLSSFPSVPNTFNSLLKVLIKNAVDEWRQYSIQECQYFDDKADSLLGIGIVITIWKAGNT